MPKTILVAALNWGMGHAMRMVPVIRHLQQEGHAVVIASDGAPGKVLQGLFRDAPYVELPSYAMRYPDRWPAWAGVLMYAPNIWKAIRLERKVIAATVKEFSPDLIISDNRYGCYDPSIPSFLVTHQLQPPVPPAFSAVQGIMSRQASRWMAPFERIWIPDVPELDATGAMSKPLPGDSHRVDYLGWLSGLSEEPSSFSAQWLVCISGPEPARSRFESAVLQSASPEVSLQVVGGNLYGSASTDKRLLPYATPGQMGTMIKSADRIMARAGYTTLMDLLRWQKSALLVPTPGQTEQEYLARRFHDKGWMPMVPQQAIGSDVWKRDWSGFQLPEIPADAFTRYAGILDRYIR